MIAQFSPVAMVTAAMQSSQCIESIYLKWRKVVEESEMSPLEGNVQDTSEREVKISSDLQDESHNAGGSGEDVPYQNPSLQYRLSFERPGFDNVQTA